MEIEEESLAAPGRRRSRSPLRVLLLRSCARRDRVTLLTPEVNGNKLRMEQTAE